MLKHLTKHGNSSAIVIEKPILDLLGATPETVFEVVSDGTSLILTPIVDAARHDRFHESMEKIGRCHAKSFEELAK